MMRMLRRFYNHGQGVALGILLALSAATPVLADVASDQKAVFGGLLPIFIVIGTVLYAVGAIMRKDASALFKGLVVGLMGFIISLFLVDIL